MPVEQAKEAAKVLVETSGSLSGVWSWIITALGGSVVGLWGHVTGRIKKLEDTIATSTMLKDHIEDENEKFNAIFEKMDHSADKISTIAASVARIEGVLSRNPDWKDH